MTQAAKKLNPADSNPVITLAEFCERYRMSKTKYYNLPIKPRLMLNRITPEAEAEWRHKMEEAEASEAAQLERERRSELARRAGKKAAKSPNHVSNRFRGKALKPVAKKAKGGKR